MLAPGAGRPAGPSAGELPLSVVHRFSALRCTQEGRGIGQSGDPRILDLEAAGPGFTLPANIGDLDPAIRALILSNCNLIGNSQSINQAWPALFIYLFIHSFVFMLATPSQYKVISPFDHLINVNIMQAKSQRVWGYSKIS